MQRSHLSNLTLSGLIAKFVVLPRADEQIYLGENDDKEKLFGRECQRLWDNMALISPRPAIWV